MSSDEQLFCAYQERGDRESLEELFERHREDVYRAARRILRNDADANDATQSAFLSALRSMDRLKNGNRFPGWLRRIAVNTALELRRSRASECARERVAGGRRLSGEGAGVSTDQRELLREALDGLPEEYRLPIVLHHCEGYSYEEISALLDWPRGTVGTNIHRGLEALRSALEPRLEISDHTLAILLGSEGPGSDSALASLPSSLA